MIEMTIESLLEVRKEMKERKPVFIRQDNPKRMKLNYKWRKPKGIHSKIRHKFKGRRKMPSPGYKSPIKVRGLHSSGLEMVSVHSIDDIPKIKNETQGIIIPKNVGSKKRLEILKKAKELSVAVLNFNADERIKKIEDMINLRKKKGQKEQKKAEAKEEKEKKAKEHKIEASKLTDEAKKEAEKKEKDKVLIKKA